MADSVNEISNKFITNYISKYKKSPAMPADMAYDAMMLILHAIDSIGLSPEKVQILLSQTKDFPGASGTITFDKNGDVIKPFTINEIVDKKIKIVWNWTSK